MAIKNDSRSEHQASRRKSLRYHSDQEKPEIPAYLKAVSASEEEEALASTKTSSVSLPTVASDSSTKTQGVITITMNRASIFSILVGIMLAGVCFAAIGFLLSYLFFNSPQAPEQPKQAVEAQSPVAAAPVPAVQTEAHDEGERLAKMAESISSQFPAPAEPATQAGKDIKEAGEKIEHATKSVTDVAKLVPVDLTAATKPAEALPADFYSIHLAEADSEPQAKDMQTELKSSGIDTFIQPIENNEGRLVYHVQTGKFSTYQDARRTLLGLAKPFSMWARIMKIEAHNGLGKGKR
jgi:hypothetical protein